MKPFIPSSYLLEQMIASAEAKFEASREQSRLRREAQREEREVRAQVNAVKARYYHSIQLGSL